MKIPRRSRVFLLLLPACFGLVACSAEEPPEPAAGTFEWTSYSNPIAGFTMDVPDLYSPREEKGSVLFRDGGRVPIKVYWITAEEGRRRGLWFGEESTGDIALGGVSGRGYAYDHCDGPFCSRMLSYVVPHRGKELALEFRSDGPLNAVNAHVLESFSLTPEAAVDADAPTGI